MSGGLGLSTGRVLRNTVFRAGGSGLTLLVGAATGIIVARGLGPEQFGSFSFVWTIAWGAAMVVPLGLDRLLVRELNRARPMLDLRRVLPLVTGVGLAVAAVLATLGGVFGGGDIPVAMAAAAVYVAAAGPLVVLVSVFDAHERMGISSGAYVIESLTGLAGVMVANELGAGLAGVSIALATARLLAIGAAAVVLSRFGASAVAAEHRPWSEILRNSLPMAGSSAAQESIRRIDIIVLGLIVAPSDVGLYAAAATIALHAPALMSELNRALYPVLSRADSPDDDDLRWLLDSAWRTQLMVGASAAAGLAVVAVPLVGFLFGAEYEPAGAVLALLALSVPFHLLATLCSLALDATDRQDRRLRASIAAAGVNLALNVALIPFFGIWGAAIASVVGKVGLLVLTAGALAPYRPPIARSLGGATITTALVATVAWLTPGHVLLRVGVGLVAFLAVGVPLLSRQLDLDLPKLRALLRSSVGERPT